MADEPEAVEGTEPSLSDQLRAARAQRGDSTPASEAQTPPSSDGETPPASTNPWGDDFDPERAWRTIQAQRETEKDLRAQVTRYEREKMSADERIKAELEDLRRENETLRVEGLKSQVAAAKGLPSSALRFLDGKDQRELESNADELLRLIGTGASPSPPDFGNGARPLAKPDADDFSAILRRAAGRPA